MTSKKRHRCWRCKRRLIIDKLEEVIRCGRKRYQCRSLMDCEFIVGFLVSTKRDRKVDTF